MTVPDGYHTPRSVSEAYRFGQTGGKYGRLSWAEFFSAPDDPPHPYPGALYDSYVRGLDWASARKRRNTQREAAA